MVKIDLNADLGEGGSADAELMTLVSSVNIACGFHAGDAQTMLESVRNAIKNGVAIGAHPSFPDRENFGRTAMDYRLRRSTPRRFTRLARWRRLSAPSRAYCVT
jgi:UPF0271 protein